MKKDWVLAIMFALTTGCQRSEYTSKSRVFEQEIGSVPMQVLRTESGVRERTCGRTPCRERNFSVYLSTEYSWDEMSIRWSDDGGKSWQQASGSEVEARIWKVSAVSVHPENDVLFEPYGKRDGHLVPDPVRNHHLDQGTSLTSPVRIEGVEVQPLGEHALSVEVEVEGFPSLAAENLQVLVAGQNSPLTCVLYKERHLRCGGDFEFSDPFSGRLLISARRDVDGAEDHIEVAVRPETRVTLSPLGLENLVDDNALSGTILLRCTYSTDVNRSEVRFDGGVWVEGDTLSLNTSALSEGPHVVECRANGGRGLEESQSRRIFQVRNPFSVEATAQVPAIESGGEALIGGVLGWTESGDVLAAYRSESRLEVVSKSLFSGTETRSWVLPFQMSPAVAVERNGLLAVADTELGLLAVASRSGSFLAHIPREWVGTRLHLLILADRVLVASPASLAVGVLDLEGQWVGVFPWFDVGCNPSQGFAWAEERGHVLLTCGDAAFRMSLQPKGWAREEQIRFSRPIPGVVSLVVGRSGDFWLAAASPARIIHVSERGQVLTTWHSSERGESPGDFGTPSFLGMEPGGGLVLGQAFSSVAFLLRPSLGD